jgi:hypothetical protein
MALWIIFPGGVTRGSVASIKPLPIPAMQNNPPRRAQNILSQVHTMA